MAKIRIESFIKKAAAAINLDLLSDDDKKAFDERTEGQKAQYLGFGGGYRQDFDTPNYIRGDYERTVAKGNSFIVLGLDRPSNIFSGFGGARNTHCASIDIVTGRLGYRGASQTKGGKAVNIDPSFKLDAARVYISQKSDPDGYFGLVKGTVGNTSKTQPRSTVAMKADTLRLIARENIKLVTRTDDQNSQGASLGNAYVGNYGIDLIALNDDKELQPLVKGDNLKECLNGIIESIHDFRELFNNFVEYNRDMNMALIKHTHNSPFFGTLTSPDFTGIMPTGIETLIDTVTNVQLQLNTQMQKLNSVQTNYLEAPGGAVATKDGKSQYILSRYNNAN